jgi:hypothetical protein
MTAPHCIAHYGHRHMISDEYDETLITITGIDTLLGYLPYFSSKRARFGQPMRIDHGCTTFSSLTKKSQRFCNACYTHHFVQPFDWHAWSREHERLVFNGDAIEELCLADIGRLLTTHLRGDRYCDQHLLGVMRSGQMRRILKRLQQLRPDMLIRFAEPRTLAESHATSAS